MLIKLYINTFLLNNCLLLLTTDFFATTMKCYFYLHCNYEKTTTTDYASINQFLVTFIYRLCNYERIQQLCTMNNSFVTFSYLSAFWPLATVCETLNTGLIPKACKIWTKEFATTKTSHVTYMNKYSATLYFVSATLFCYL